MFWEGRCSRGKTNQDEQRGEAETWGWKEEMRVPETDKGRRSGRESEKVLGHGSDRLRIRSLRKQ